MPAGHDLNQRRRPVFVVHAPGFGRGGEEKLTPGAPAGFDFFAAAGHRAGRGGVLKISLDPQGKGQPGGTDFPAAGQNRFRDGKHFVASRIGDVNQRQLMLTAVFAVIGRAADGQAHHAFDLELFGEELAGQQENQPGVNQQDADSLPGEVKSLDMRRQQIEQQRQPDGENDPRDATDPERHVHTIRSRRAPNSPLGTTIRTRTRMANTMRFS